jgi:spermidine/putrescine transport system ATP-binding protein
MSKLIHAKNIVKSYADTNVVNNVSVWVKEKEFLTILGPSGCGKTTILKILGGFVQPDQGEVIFNNHNITALPPYEREINTVFQKYALFPHMNVFENIAFGLKIKKLKKNEIKNKVKKILSLVNLSGFEKRLITQLSGGQQQRIAIARALVNEPKVLLLDEPLGALDLKLRKEMQVELKNMQKKLGITFIYVTHDQEEALTMSDKIIVMNDGIVQQVGEPKDIYNEPANAFVARFIGESNIFNGIMLKDYLVEVFGRELKCLDADFNKNESVDVVIRPEDFKIVEANQGFIKGIVEAVVFKGVHYEIVVNAEKYTFTIHTTIESQVNDVVGLQLTPDDLHIMKKVGEIC